MQKEVDGDCDQGAGAADRRSPDDLLLEIVAKDADDPVLHAATGAGFGNEVGTDPYGTWTSSMKGMADVAARAIDPHGGAAVIVPGVPTCCWMRAHRRLHRRLAMGDAARSGRRSTGSRREEPRGRRSSRMPMALRWSYASLSMSSARLRATSTSTRRPPERLAPSKIDREDESFAVAMATTRYHRAMPSFELRRTIDAPRSIIWDLLIDHAGYAGWTTLSSSTLERAGRDHRNGVGAVRRLRAGLLTFREEVVSFEPEHAFSYTVLSGVPVRDYLAAVTLEARGSDRTELTWRVDFEKKLPFTGTVLKIGVKKAIRDLLAAAAKEAPRRAR